MNPSVSEEYSDFREEVRTWFAEHLVGEFHDHRGVGSPTDDTAWDVRLAWERELAEGNWLGLTWPVEYGGRGLGLAEEIVFEYEYARAAAPARVNTQALELLGPTLLAYGSDEQKSRFLPKILAVEEMWGQGFSEPGAGSDLAAVRTKAVLADSEWHIDGQKVWTTFGDRADWLYVLCRTDPDPSLRHRGLTLLLVPVDQPGVEIRPIANIARSKEFSECFFNDARTTDDMVVGGAGNGWPVVMSTLGRERGSALIPMQLAVEREVGELVEAARRFGALDDRRLRQRLVDAVIGVHIMRSTNLRVVSDLLDGRRIRRGDDRGGDREQAVRVDPPSAAGRVGRRNPRSTGIFNGDEPRWTPASCSSQPRRDDLRRHIGDPAQHHRRTRARPTPLGVIWQ